MLYRTREPTFTDAARPPATRNLRNWPDISPSGMRASNESGQPLSDPHALGDRSVFRVIVRGVRDEQTATCALHRGQLFEETRRTNCLRELIPKSICRENICPVEVRPHPLKIPDCF